MLLLLLRPTRAEEALCLCIVPPMFSLAKLFEKIEELVIGLDEDPTTDDCEDFGIPFAFPDGLELGGYPEGHIMAMGRFSYSFFLEGVALKFE
jgi:hypothetical protein